MPAFYTQTLEKWHEFIKSGGRQPGLLEQILADEVVFHSPVVWTPQAGKATTIKYLTAAAEVLEDFEYHRQFVSEDSVALEFSARTGDTIVKGIDLIRFDRAGRIIDFEVMARPGRALPALAAVMGPRLAALNTPAPGEPQPEPEGD